MTAAEPFTDLVFYNFFFSFLRRRLHLTCMMPDESRPLCIHVLLPGWLRSVVKACRDHMYQRQSNHGEDNGEWVSDAHK